MIKIIFANILVLFIFFVSVNNIFAFEDKDNNFNIVLENATSDLLKNNTKLNIKIEDLDSNDFSWKIKAECEGSMSLKVANKYSNLCYSKRDIKIKDNIFEIIFKKNNNKSRNFSLILESYYNGKFVSSERENFKFK